MDPYVGQLLLVPYNFAPVGWAFCQGQLMSITDNDVLFALIGTTYGGDGQQTFALPDLRGRTPIAQGQGPGTGNFVIGQLGGVEQVTLTNNQVPLHNHALSCAAVLGDSEHVNNSLLGDGQTVYSDTPGSAAMGAGTVSSIGGGQPHENLQPGLTLNWIISLFGVFPTQN